MVRREEDLTQARHDEHRVLAHQESQARPAGADSRRRDARRLRSIQLLSTFGHAPGGSARHKDYAGGQDGVVHLVSHISHATGVGRPWAFTDRHAELAHALYYDDLRHLSEVQWDVMPMRWWSAVGEERQAEFLVHDFFPWTCVVEVAAATDATAQRARQLFAGARHVPPVVVRPDWYY